MTKCKICYGYGFWAWGPIQPMGPLDAEDGMPTMKCPLCMSNPNPIDDKYDLTERKNVILNTYREILNENDNKSK